MIRRRGLEALRRLGNAVADRSRDAADRRRIDEDEIPPLGDELRDGYHNGWRDVPCTFVASTGRAGSKTLTALWRLAPDVQAEHEPLPRLVHASGRAWHDPFDDRWIDVIHGARDDLIGDAHRRGLLYAETNNRLTSLAPAFLHAFGSSRGVLLWRRPETFVVSGLRRGYYEGHHWDFARYTPRADDPFAERWDTWPTGLKVTWLWAATNTFILDLVEAQPRRWTVLASSQLFAGEPRTLAQAFAAVDADVPADAKIKRVLSSKINAQQDGDAHDVPFEGDHAAEYREVVEPVLERLQAASARR